MFRPAVQKHVREGRHSEPFRAAGTMQVDRNSLNQSFICRKTADEVIGESGTPPMERSVSPQQVMRCRPGSGESDTSVFTSSRPHFGLWVVCSQQHMGVCLHGFAQQPFCALYGIEQCG